MSAPYRLPEYTAYGVPPPVVKIWASAPRMHSWLKTNPSGPAAETGRAAKGSPVSGLALRFAYAEYLRSLNPCTVAINDPAGPATEASEEFTLWIAPLTITRLIWTLKAF